MARSILTDAERLAWERFPADPDPDAIGIYFTLADGEIDILRRLPTPGARLSTAEHDVRSYLDSELRSVPMERRGVNASRHWRVAVGDYG